VPEGACADRLARVRRRDRSHLARRHRRAPTRKLRLDLPSRTVRFASNIEHSLIDRERVHDGCWIWCLWSEPVGWPDNLGPGGKGQATDQGPILLRRAEDVSASVQINDHTLGFRRCFRTASQDEHTAKVFSPRGEPFGGRRVSRAAFRRSTGTGSVPSQRPYVRIASTIVSNARGQWGSRRPRAILRHQTVTVARGR
jgi:hypothetical protein